MAKINKCLKGIKQCLNPSKNQDYEYVSYDHNSPEKHRNIQTKDQLIKSSKIQIHFNEIEPINEFKKQNTNINNTNSNLLFSKPMFHSTQLEQTIDSSIYMSALAVDNYDYKKSSTMINSNQNESILSDNLLATQIKSNDSNITDDLSQYTTRLFVSESNSLYFSPIKRNKFVQINKSNDSTESSSYFTNDETSESEDFQTVRSSIYVQSTSESIQDQLHVCIVPYSAKIQGDLSLKYAERVKVIHSNNDFSLVQNIVSKQCGYVPTNCIVLLSNFLNQL